MEETLRTYFAYNKKKLKAIDREDNQKVGECTVTGKEENQRQITFYGKYAADYEDFKKMNTSDENNSN